MTDTIPARLFAMAVRQPGRTAYRWHDGSGWQSATWAAYAEEVRTAARALLASGVGPGDTVCILGNNRPEWVVLDVAAMCIGAIPAGIYATCSATEVAFILHHAAAKVVLVENAAQAAKVREIRGTCPDLRHVVTMRGAPATDDTLGWEPFLARAAVTDAAQVDTSLAALGDDDTATLIYTSGTTGNPKGVMLTHLNLSRTASNAAALVSITADDRMVSYLPLSHIAEQMFTIHAAITGGYEIWYARSMDTLLDDLKAARPTVLFGVPRVWEKMHARLSGVFSQATGAKAGLLRWAQGVGRANIAALNAGATPSFGLRVQHRLAHKLIFSKVKQQLGLDDARFGISGAAPISAEVLEFFSGLDLPIFEVYGQSEDTGPTSFNVPGKTRYGTVGVAFPECDIRIADDGEVLVRGPNVFKGYYKDADATAATLVDGWLHSGDLGRLDDGFLSIIGRKKEILITSGGKNITPVNIEAKLKDLPLVSQAVVIGDRRHYLTALVTLDPEAARAFADANGLSGALHEAPAVRDAIQRGIDDQVNPSFARVEHVRKFTILPGDFSTDTGELTPTLKIKRRVVNEKYRDAIDALYVD